MISIIIPTLNEERFLPDTLASLKRLTLPHEVIVSDGGSTDNTVHVARALADKVVEHKEAFRQNISQGRNAGAHVASGEFLVFFDADSRVHDPDAFFSHALSRFAADSQLVAMTSIIKVAPDKATLADRIIFGILNMNLRMLNNVLHKGESTGEFQMIRKHAFDKLHGFREDLITREDADMFLRLSKIGKTRLDPELVTYHSGRRAHKVGWPKLLSQWAVNTVWVALFDKAVHKEWKVVR